MTTDTRDDVLFSLCPPVPVPRFGTLDDLAVGRKRFLLASDGVYLEVRSEALHARLRIAPVQLPYGSTNEFLRPAGGPLEVSWLGQLANLALCDGTREVAAGIVRGPEGWALVEPPVLSASGSHVTYADVFEDKALLIDMHSHGAHPEYFSAIDDESDMSREGPYIAVVLGRCQSRETLKSCMRFVCPPYLIPLSPADLTRLGVL